MEITTEEQVKKATFEETFEEVLDTFDKEGLKDIIRFLKEDIYEFKKISRKYNGTANRITVDTKKVIDTTKTVHSYLYNCEDIDQFKKFDLEMILKIETVGTFNFVKITGSAEHGGLTIEDAEEVMKLVSNFYKSRYRFINKD